MGIVAAAVVVKLLLGNYVKKKGQETNSDSLVNSGQDAVLDAGISFSTLVAAAVYMFFDISLEAWLGAAISVVIVKAGFDMLRDTISQILGERVDKSVTKAVKSTLNSMEGIYGAYDLILHAYGPDRYQGSVHIEVPDTCTADEIDTLTRQAVEKVYDETGVVLTGVGIYSMNTKNDKAKQMQERIRQTVMRVDHVLQMHAFYYNEETKALRFDIVVDFMAKDRGQVYAQVYDAVLRVYPEVELAFNMDADISD
jgi:divalent metal cation (Fe/Co/Zn/Cd) transporter